MSPGVFKNIQCCVLNFGKYPKGLLKKTRSLALQKNSLKRPQVSWKTTVFSGITAARNVTRCPQQYQVVWLKLWTDSFTDLFDCDNTSNLPLNLEISPGLLEKTPGVALHKNGWKCLQVFFKHLVLMPQKRFDTSQGFMKNTQFCPPFDSLVSTTLSPPPGNIPRSP